jgi:hypothetical protein
MANQLGNPDWQRRYTTSMAPLASLTYNDNINSASGIIDSNGFEYLLITTNGGSSLVFAHVKIDWFQDAAASLQMGDTDYTIPPQVFIVQKIPVATRYFKVEIGPVGGTTGNTIQMVCYGSNADQENLLTQNTAVPMGHGNPSLGASVVQTTVLGGIFGGRVFVSVDQNANNKWTSWLEYYDWTTQTWVQFWTIHGPDHGQSYSNDALLPYAPCRINVRNDDTVAHVITWSVVAP